MVEEKINCVDLTDSVMVERRIVVECDEVFGVLVADCLERSEFPFECGFVSDGKRNLEISGSCILKSDEINLPAVDRSNIDVAVAPLEFEEYYVLENGSSKLMDTICRGLIPSASSLSRKSLRRVVFPQRRMPVTTFMMSLSRQLESQLVKYGLFIVPVIAEVLLRQKFLYV